MKRFTRKSIDTNCKHPQGMFWQIEGNFSSSLKYHLTYSFVFPWYGYLFIAAVCVGFSFVIDWWIVLFAVAVVGVAKLGAALYTASTFTKLAKAGLGVNIDEDGIFYATPQNDADDEGNMKIQVSAGSSWYELNEIRVYKHFIVLKFVPTSQLRIVFIPLTNEDFNLDYYLDQILGFWKQKAQDKPQGQFDTRLIYILLIVALFAFKFLHHYFS